MIKIIIRLVQLIVSIPIIAVQVIWFIPGIIIGLVISMVYNIVSYILSGDLPFRNFEYIEFDIALAPVWLLIKISDIVKEMSRKIN